MINVIPSEDIQRIFKGMVKHVMTKAELQARERRIVQEQRITCLDCGEEYRVVKLIWPAWMLAAARGWCECKSREGKQEVVK